MQRATQDVEGIRMFVNMGVIRLVYVAALLVAALVLMFITNWQLALLSAVFIPPTAFFAIMMTTTLRPIWLEVQNLQGRIGVVLQENLSGMRVVKAFGREAFERDKFNAEAQNLFVNSYATNRIQAKYSPVLTGVWALAMVATGWYGAIADPARQPHDRRAGAVPALPDDAAAAGPQPRLDQHALGARAVVRASASTTSSMPNRRSRRRPDAGELDGRAGPRARSRTSPSATTRSARCSAT